MNENFALEEFIPPLFRKQELPTEEMSQAMSSDTTDAIDTKFTATSNPSEFEQYFDAIPFLSNTSSSNLADHQTHRTQKPIYVQPATSLMKIGDQQTDRAQQLVNLQRKPGIKKIEGSYVVSSKLGFQSVAQPELNRATDDVEVSMQTDDQPPATRSNGGYVISSKPGFQSFQQHGPMLNMQNPMKMDEQSILTAMAQLEERHQQIVERKREQMAKEEKEHEKRKALLNHISSVETQVKTMDVLRKRLINDRTRDAAENILFDASKVKHARSSCGVFGINSYDNDHEADYLVFAGLI